MKNTFDFSSPANGLRPVARTPTNLLLFFLSLSLSINSLTWNIMSEQPAAHWSAGAVSLFIYKQVRSLEAFLYQWWRQEQAKNTLMSHPFNGTVDRCTFTLQAILLSRELRHVHNTSYHFNLKRCWFAFSLTPWLRWKHLVNGRDCEFCIVLSSCQREFPVFES